MASLGKFIETENRTELLGAGGWERKGSEDYYLMDTDFVGMMEKFWK